jgi:hypothetical protein
MFLFMSSASYQHHITGRMRKSPWRPSQIDQSRADVAMVAVGPTRTSSMLSPPFDARIVKVISTSQQKCWSRYAMQAAEK